MTHSPLRLPIVLLLALTAAACSETVVDVVGVTLVEVDPDTATLTVGDEIPLHVTARDGSGNTLGGRSVTWSSAAPAVAAVGAQGRVTAVAPGTARITATVEGVSGEAAITVEPRPAIGLDTDQIAFSGAPGGADPEPATISVVNDGGGTLGGLSAATSYAAGQPVGWLAASLDAVAAPATLTLDVTVGTLAVGSYTATVELSAAGASNSPRTVEVTLVVSTDPGPAPTPPAAPSGLQATAVSPNQINLSWTDNSDNETGFRIERKTAPAGTFGEVGRVSAGLTAYGDINLDPATTFAYRVRACNAAGCSAYSGEAAATTPAEPSIALSQTTVEFAAAAAGTDPAPATVVVTNGGGGTLNGIAIDSVVHAAGEPTGWLAVAPGDGTAPDSLVFSATVGSLTVDTLHATAYVSSPVATNSPRMIAVTFQISPEPPPDAPSGLTATVISDTQIDLAWADNSGNEDVFELEHREGEGGAWTVVDSLPPNTTSHPDTGLTGGIEYAYRIRACNDSGCSAYSAEVLATTMTSPEIAIDSASVTFNAELGGADPATKTVVVSNGGEVALTGLATEIAYAGGEPIGWLDVGGGDGTAPDSYTLTATLGALTADTLHATVTITSPVAINSPQTIDVTFNVTLPPVPQFPTGLTANAASPSRIDLTWTDASDNETGFQIERQTGGGEFATIATIADVGAGVTGYTDELLDDGVTYTYRVRACNAGGCSDPPSDTASATTPPIAPSGLTATAFSDTRIDLSWTDNSGTEDRFELERQEDGSAGWTLVDSIAPNTTAFADTLLTAGTTYQYQIRACVSAVCSEYSATAQAMTQAAPAIGLSADSVGFIATAGGANPAPETVVISNAGGGALTGLQDTVIYQGAPPPKEWLTSNLSAQNAPADLVLTADTTDLPAGAYEAIVEVTSPVASNSPDSVTVTFTVEAAPPPPDAPTGLTATAASDTTIDLSWTDNSDDKIDFRIERKSEAGEFAQVAIVEADGTTYLDTGLTLSTEYTYRVQACNANGCSASDEATATTDAAPAIGFSQGHVTSPVASSGRALLEATSHRPWAPTVPGR